MRIPGFGEYPDGARICAVSSSTIPARGAFADVTCGFDGCPMRRDKGFCFSRGLQHWQLPVEIMAQQNDRRIGIDLSAG